MLSLKLGVKVGGIRPEIILALMVAEDVYDLDGSDCVVTACLDGKHMKGSLHYKGLAVDLRTRSMTMDQEVVIRDRIKQSLGDEYDVILEADHLHIEFDPKEGKRELA